MGSHRARTRVAGGLIALSVLVLAGAAGATAQSPSPSASSDGTLPPPPAWFDPSVLRFVMSREGELDHTRTGDPLLIAAVDGSGMEAIEAPPFFKAQLAADGRIVLLGTTDTDASPPLLVRDPDGSVRTLSPSASDFWLDADRDDVYSFGKGPGDGAYGLWRLPLDGRQPKRVLRVGDQEDIVMSADGRSIAVGQKGDPAGSFLTARFDGGPQQDLGSGYPIGFDPQGRLFFGGFTRIVRYDPVSGKKSPLDLSGLGHIDDLRITPSTRYLVIQHGPDDHSRVQVRDLAEGDRRDFDLGSGGFYLVSLDDRYVVLQHRSDADDAPWTDGVAIIDLLEGWIGFLPWKGTVPMGLGGGGRWGG